jgi:hypothetical protein
MYRGKQRRMLPLALFFCTVSRCRAAAIHAKIAGTSETCSTMLMRNLR